ncbi:hypothetical protein RCJ22_38490, partial [Vibrio sp. FNV 38]|nr:hypothetical protein [Vibrio sp. FNV 38]
YAGMYDEILHNRFIQSLNVHYDSRNNTDRRVSLAITMALVIAGRTTIDGLMLDEKNNPCSRTYFLSSWSNRKP